MNQKSLDQFRWVVISHLHHIDEKEVVLASDWCGMELLVFRSHYELVKSWVVLELLFELLSHFFLLDQSFGQFVQLLDNSFAFDFTVVLLILLLVSFKSFQDKCGGLVLLDISISSFLLAWDQFGQILFSQFLSFLGKESLQIKCVLLSSCLDVMLFQNMHLVHILPVQVHNSVQLSILHQKTSSGFGIKRQLMVIISRSRVVFDHLISKMMIKS